MVPVSQTDTLRETVRYVTEIAIAAADAGERPSLHFVYPYSWVDGGGRGVTGPEGPRVLLDRVSAWVDEDLEAGGRSDVGVTVETEIVGTEDYLFSPTDYADVIERYRERHDVDLVVLDPQYEGGRSLTVLAPLEDALADRGIPFEEASVGRPRRRVPLVTRGGAARSAVVAAVAYGFYLVLGDPTSTFDLTTGVAVAGLTAAVLDRVVFLSQPRPVRSPLVAARWMLFLPYLIWEVVEANLAIAYVVLHPDLPIEPRTVRYGASVWGALPATTLANSITLTPGTLTVGVRGNDFTIHTLTAGARDGLREGRLERAVRFVFYGREAFSHPSPEERDDVATVDPDEVTEP